MCLHPLVFYVALYLMYTALNLLIRSCYHRIFGQFTLLLPLARCARSVTVFSGQLVTLPMDDVIPVPLKSTLERVCRKFFNRDAAHKSPKHQRFVELYQATFEKDFEVCVVLEENVPISAQYTFYWYWGAFRDHRLTTAPPIAKTWK